MTEILPPTINYENKTIKTDNLIPYVKNSRNHEDDQVAQIVASIKEFGFTNPILVDEKFNVIAGHGRLMAAKQMELDKVPVRILKGLTDDQKKAYVIADNKIALNSTWNTDILKSEIEEIEKNNQVDLSLLGFSDIELQELLTPKIDDSKYDEDTPSLEETYDSKKGTIYNLGRHKVLCGSATEEKDVKKLMGDELSDLILTDPPYGVTYVSAGKRDQGSQIKNDGLRDNDLYNFLKDSFDLYYKFSKEGAPIYVWHAEATLLEFLSAFKESKFKLHETLYWLKNNFNFTRMDYHPLTEPCLTGQRDFIEIKTDDVEQTWEDTPDYAESGLDGRVIYGWKEGKRHTWMNSRKEKNILRWKKPARSEEHPTMKPIGMMKYLIRNSSRKNSLVVDNFLGSGSTLIAAELTGRKCYGIELDERYVDVIRKRYTKIALEKGMTPEQIGNGYLE